MSVGSRRLRVATVEVGTVGSTSGSRGSVGKRQVGRPKKLPSQVRNQPAIHRFFGSVDEEHNTKEVENNDVGTVVRSTSTSTVGSTSTSTSTVGSNSVGKRCVGRPKKLPSQDQNQPAIHRLFGSR